MDEVLNRAQIIAAFARWEKDKREGAAEFFSQEDCDAMSVEELAERNADALFQHAAVVAAAV